MPKMRKKGTHTTTKTTKGWQKAAPKTRQSRRRLLKRCGTGAFLQPGKKPSPGFPIVSAKGPCAPDCRGLRAAKQRASRYGYPSLVKKATTVAKRAGCRWAVKE